MVKVKPTANQGRITVKTSNDTNVFGIKDNLSEYYAKQAENWAHSAGIVNGIDYSSKYYAEQSKASAQVADEAKTATQELIENFDNKVQIAKDDIEQDRINSINAIDNTYSVAVGDMQEKSYEALTSIETLKAEAENSISNTKTTAINDIEFVAEGEKQEIEELIDTGKDELKEAIGDVKILTTLEIGDVGFTQMAIDETLGKRRVLNGQLIIQEQYVEFTNKVKSSVALNPDLACTESEWQTTVTMSANGVCYKFVIDDEAGTIRLPKYPQYLDLSINGAKTVSVYGNGKTLGMTDGTNNYGTGLFSNLGISVSTGNLGQAVGSTNGTVSTIVKAYGITTDASKSGLTGSVTTSSEQIKGTYFIQVATGAETEDNIINEIELNNPFSLLDYKYSEYELNNLSWLRSNGQYNSKAIYPAVYDLLLKIYNGTETKAGVSVKLSTGSYTDYDFVLNTADETFRLPVKVKQKFYNSGDVPVVGNGKTLGLDDGTGTVALGYAGGDLRQLRLYSEGVGASIGTSVSTVVGNDRKSYGVTTDSSKSGLVAKLSSTEVSGLYLYFYVGETVQNANLINAGRIEEKVATLISDNMDIITSSGFPSNKSVTLTIGASGSTYVAPANGWFILNCQTRDTATTSNRYVALDNYSTGMTDMRWFTNATDLEYSGFVPAKKGETVALVYSGSLALNSWGTGFKFIYAEGDQ